MTLPLTERAPTKESGPVAVSPWSHVLEMCDGIGMFEHAEMAEPRREEGYCTDDMARLLIAIVREPTPSADLAALLRMCMRFLVGAQGVSGKVRNRRDTTGRWHGRRGVEDCWGRSVWAFGTAARLAPDRSTQERAAWYFGHAVGQRSPHRRAMAFAALGAAEFLVVAPRDLRARALLHDAITAIGPIRTDPSWPWPEPRLSYANAVLAEALIAAGNALERPDVVADGLTLLRWLIERQTFDGHLSPVPVGGAGPTGRARAFDQQPIEIAALADACARAEAVTGDTHWRAGVELAVDWFMGVNDVGVPMSDPVTGGGYDGLTVEGANLNQGAESTLALITTLQRGRGGDASARLS